MRNLALSLAAAVMLFAAPASTIAQEFEIGPGGVRVEPYRYNHGYYRHGYGPDYGRHGYYRHGYGRGYGRYGYSRRDYGPGNGRYDRDDW